MGEQNEREAYNEAAREDYEGREREAMDRPMFTQREVDAAIAAAVQAEREAIRRRAIECIENHSTERDGDFSDGYVQAVSDVAATLKRWKISPTIPTVGEWVQSHQRDSWAIIEHGCVVAYADINGDWSIYRNQERIEEGRTTDAESAKRAAVDALVRQGWYRETTATFDLVAHLYRQREFSERTFGPGGRTAGICDHIRKELVEVAKDPTIREWVDVIILALDGAWRSGATPEEIVAAIEAKQSTNEARTWPNWRTVPEGKAIEHDRTAEESSGVDQ